MEEIWRDIEGFEGLYQVSSYGRIKSLNYNKTKQERILKNFLNKKGYLQVNLHKDGKIKKFSVHRLVATAFLENPNNLPQVNHKDENKSNNCVSNLEWCDCQYNINYGTRTEKTVEKCSKQVYQYSLNGNLIKVWESSKECGRNGFNQGAISSCCNEKIKTHKGFIWSYKDLDTDGWYRSYSLNCIE